MNPEARKKTGRDQEQSHGRHNDPWTETAAIVELSPSLRMYKVQERYRVNHKDPLAGTESTSGTALAGLSMGLFGASRLTAGC